MDHSFGPSCPVRLDNILKIVPNTGIINILNSGVDIKDFFLISTSRDQPRLDLGIK